MKNKLSITSVSLFFILWETVARLNLIDPLFISSPLKIFSSGSELISSGEIFPHLLLSMEAFFIGFILSIIVGVAGGMIITSNKNLYNIFLPYVLALNSLPMITLVPLVIIWFGIGVTAKIVIVFLIALKPILINTIDGVDSVDGKLVKMAKSFGADKIFILKTITFYSILPFAFSGLSIAVGRGLIGLIVGETFGYGKGIGFLVAFYGNTYQTSRLMFMILVLLTISFIITGLLAKIKKIMIKWKK